jgi:hypothetical protein
VSALVIWTSGGGKKEFPLDGQGACVEVVLEDGRTYQMYVVGDGSVHVRAWGNVPALLGNGTMAHFSAAVPQQAPTHDANGHPLQVKS